MATSVTGVSGAGTSGKYTTTELAILANGPSIFFTGIIEVDGSSSSPPSSPPSSTNTLVFPYALVGGAEHYVVLLTTLNGGAAYVTDTDEDSDGNFIGFSLIAEADCSVMYLVANAGIRPTI